MHSQLRLFVLLLGLHLVVGCGVPSDRPEIAEVTGTVTLDGIPMSGLLVLFGPEVGRTSSAWTDEKGQYRLMYLPDVPGAVVGTHTVSISSGYEEEEEPPPGEEPYLEPIPAVYNTGSTLTREVTADGPNVFDFDLQSDAE